MARLALLAVVPAACGGGGGFPDARIIDVPPPGTFSLAWTVTDTNSQSLPCERIGAQSVTVLVRNTNFEGGSTQVFTCGTGMGTSQGLAPGKYNLDFELVAVDGVLQRAPSQLAVAIASGVETPLAPVVFAVEATGALALALATGRPGGNCGATSVNGAGIDATTIALIHNDLTCEPITLNISAGATRPAGTYTISCTTPATGPCIESDQTLSASGVPSDAYTIRMRGKIAGRDCWVNDDGIQVPPLGKTLTRTLNLAYAAGTPGC